MAFAGHGADPLHTIAEWRWRSSLNGALATVPAFNTSALKVGIHNIYFIVRCNGPKWSAETFTPYVVGAQGTKPLPVYRFLNRRTNVHFYTASEAERRTVQTTLASTYSLEGVAYALDTSATANSSPLYRFFDRKRGVHFYTASEAEKDTVLTTLGDVYQYDGVVTYISLTPEPGTQPVYRFYNFSQGRALLHGEPGRARHGRRQARRDLPLRGRRLPLPAALGGRGALVPRHDIKPKARSIERAFRVRLQPGDGAHG